MITVLNVNGIELTIEYEFDVHAVYFGDLESEYYDIEIDKVLWDAECTDIDGLVEVKQIDILPLIDALEDTESLKHILMGRMEDEA